MAVPPEPVGTPDAELAAARRRIIEAGDNARRRLARDLHDGAQQQLVTALIRLQLAQQKLEADPAQARQMLDAGVEGTEAGLQTLRELAAGIHPPILTHFGLSAAVEALATTSPVPLSLDLTQDRLPGAIEASLYFFISEALTNVAKHANASAAGVVISAKEGHLVVEVHDDGIGGVGPASAGSGLEGLADRIGALSGDLTVTSAAGDGTTLRAEIPLPYAPAG
jgi:signal transduction histidine kinase